MGNRRNDRKGKSKVVSSSELKQRSEECNVEQQRGESSQQVDEWDDPMAVELQKLLIPLIKEASRTAIKKITECGCSEEEAEWAVLSSGIYQGYMDLTNNIVNGGLTLLDYTIGFDTSTRPLFDDLESLAGYILLEMVSVLKEMKPFLTVGEAMWLLLICDLNILYATVASTPNPTGADPQPSQPSHVSGSGKKVAQGEKGGKGSKGKRLSKTTIATSVVKTPGNVPASSSAVPVSEKDAMIVSLMQRKQQLEKEVQGWIDWTNVKVGQAAWKLSRDQDELRMLRKERQGGGEVENILKRRRELQDALFHLNAQIEAINSAHDELMAERSELMEGITESRLSFVDSCIDLQQSKLREEELQKQRRTLEVGVSSLQGELAALKGNSADLQVKIEKARKRQSEFEALWQLEEREKTKLLQKVETLRRERQEMKEKAKMEEDMLRAKAEDNRVKYEEQMNKLSTEISALKLAAVGESSGQGGLKREWECVMCLTEAKSVVFLPCSHQVLCTACNVVHERQGMKDCPVCRTLIMKRIQARFVPPKAH